MVRLDIYFLFIFIKLFYYDIVTFVFLCSVYL